MFVGLSVVYLSGKKGPGGPGCYSQDDVDALRALAEEPGIVDLFLTYPFFLLCLFHCPLVLILSCFDLASILYAYLHIGFP